MEQKNGNDVRIENKTEENEIIKDNEENNLKEDIYINQENQEDREEKK